VVLLYLLAIFCGCNHLLNGVISRKFISSFGFALHSKENHLFLAHLFNRFTGKYTSDTALYELSGDLFFFLMSGFWHLAFPNFALCLIGNEFRKVLLQNLLNTETTLATTLIFLD
jgi:hypothetical protein